jgi:hypothetical protein
MNSLRFRLIIYLVIALGLSAGVALACETFTMWMNGKPCLCYRCADGNVSCNCPQ